MTLFPNNSEFAVRVLPRSAYKQLRQALWQTAEQPESWCLSEADLPLPDQASESDWQTWLLVITPTTQALLLQRFAVEAASRDEAGTCTIGLMTDPQAVAAVITHWLTTAWAESIVQPLQLGQQTLCDRAAVSGTELLLTLLPMMGISSTIPMAIADASAAVEGQDTAQVNLDRQVKQGELLNQVITKIRNSLDFEAILSTTVAEVRQSLSTDRLLVYQFQHPDALGDATGSSSPIADDTRPSVMPGYITYESLASPAIVSVKQFSEQYCFNDYVRCHEKYRVGNPVAVNDVQTTYEEFPCLKNFLQKAQVRAKVIAPIWVKGQLWGLLIAHQCTAVRMWTEQELTFLKCIAEHLAVAIQQAELYTQLREQTQSLEACVINRTQDLKDALAAAQSASLAKSEFLATMSHELRTPLTCVIGMSATLLRWSLGELNERQRTYLKTIHDSGERLLAVINDILEMAKIESGRIVLEVQRFSLTRLAQRAIDPFRKAARDRKISINFESTLLAEQDTFTGDPRRISQVLDNLLSNALKFTHDGGTVNLRLWHEQQSAVFQVEDTGIGIPQELIPQLFQTFQQLEASRQRQYAGTGLGLALTKQLIELQGGTISVSSRVGVGSVFTVKIPLQRIKSSLPTTAPKLTSETDVVQPVVGRIVLIEDQEDRAGLICDLLTAADYQVIWMIEGSRVVEQVALLQPTIVILNMNLSSIDGQRMVTALRESLITTEVKILALTDNQVAQEAIANVNATTILPLNPELLLEQVNALIATEGSKHLSPQ
ncbi:MAG: GAF domain-containing protein [Leptolyngbya sp. SIOISBB]|nr:GAF domain-containing protein [Leptolyngbya sp. SIOISBB]